MMAVNEERYRQETRRLLDLLLAAARREGKSIRSLEKKIGVGASVLTKVASGRVIAQVRHVLMLCDALDIPWEDFYAMAGSQKNEKKIENLESQVLALLYQYGLLPKESRPGEAVEARRGD